jgi:hypothetical protein
MVEILAHRPAAVGSGCGTAAFRGGVAGVRSGLDQPSVLTRRYAPTGLQLFEHQSKFGAILPRCHIQFERKRTSFRGSSNLSCANMLQKSKRNEIMVFARTSSQCRGAAEVNETVEQACLAQTSSPSKIWTCCSPVMPCPMAIASGWKG